MSIKRIKGETLSFLYITIKGHTSSCKDFILKISKCQIIIVEQYEPK